MSESQNPRTITEIDDWMELEGKNPVSILNELYPGTQYTLMSSQVSAVHSSLQPFK